PVEIGFDGEIRLYHRINVGMLEGEKKLEERRVHQPPATQYCSHVANVNRGYRELRHIEVFHLFEVEERSHFHRTGRASPAASPFAGHLPKIPARARTTDSEYSGKRSLLRLLPARSNSPNRRLAWCNRFDLLLHGHGKTEQSEPHGEG